MERESETVRRGKIKRGIRENKGWRRGGMKQELKTMQIPLRTDNNFAS